MPVRIKYWALVSERHGDISNEWRALKKEVVALLLAWGREVNIVVRDAEHDKKFVLRWPSSEEAFSQCLDRLRATPSTSVALTRSVLAQALKMPPRFYESWVPVSASSSSLAISGAISLEPVPTRHFQFIAFGIEPLSSDNEYVTLFHTINTIFASSTFGNLEDGSMPEEDQEMLPEMRDSGMERSKQKIGSKGKGIDRWPMFFLRITPQDGQMASKLDAAQLGVNSELTLAVIEVLQATATQFLKTTGLEPRLPRVRAEPRPSALARESISTSHRSLAERHDSDQSVAIESGANPTHNLPNNESSQCRSAQASDRLGQNPDSRVRQKRFRLDDLGGGVSLPVFAGDVPYNLSSDPSTWSRMKTSKRDKCIPIRPRRATSLARTDAVPGGGKSAATNSPRLKLSSLNKQSATEIYAHGATQRSSETTDTEPRTATTQSPSVAVEGELTSANSNHLPAIDEEVTCIHPKTKVAVRYNRRTGNMARQDEERLRLSSNSIRDGHAGSDSQTPGAGKQASPTLAGQGKGQDIKSSTWFQNVLEGWENPIFCPPERPVLQVRSGSMSLAETAANPPAAYQGSSFLNVRPSDAGIDKSSLFRLSRTALREAKVISQFDGKFILVKVKCRDEPEETESNSSRKETLVAIDQHAADERCRIEELFAELCAEAPDEHGVLSGARYRSRIKTTVLDKPINFEVDESESRLFEASAAYFARWGILYDILPPSTPPRTARGREERRVAVRTIPAGVVERCKAEPNLLIDLLRREIWAREESGLIRRVHSVSSSDVDRPTSHPVDEVDPEHMDVDDDGRGWLRQIKDCPRGMMDLLNSRACRSQSPPSGTRKSRMPPLIICFQVPSCSTIGSRAENVGPWSLASRDVSCPFNAHMAGS